MQNLLKFIGNQRLLAIASRDGEEMWIANVYFGVGEKGIIYLISSENTKHSQMILKNPHIAFSTAWFDPENYKNRKAVQGLGVCRLAENEEEIITGVKLHNQNFPEFKERITVEWIHENERRSKVWVLKPGYMKYWDDELYGEDAKEFDFSV